MFRPLLTMIRKQTSITKEMLYVRGYYSVIEEASGRCEY
jgi:hypothetical protein